LGRGTNNIKKKIAQWETSTVLQNTVRRDPPRANETITGGKPNSKHHRKRPSSKSHPLPGKPFAKLHTPTRETNLKQTSSHQTVTGGTNLNHRPAIRGNQPQSMTLSTGNTDSPEPSQPPPLPQTIAILSGGIQPHVIVLQSRVTSLPGEQRRGFLPHRNINHHYWEKVTRLHRNAAKPKSYKQRKM
jgi:hypothetical protein